jgi:putative colanic acid biosynthesis glycosyltransferase WcaI
LKVSLVTQYFPPETFAGANRVAAIAAALGEIAEVTVCAPRPSYPDPAAYAGVPEATLPPGTRLVRVAEMGERRGGWTARALAEASLAWRLARAAAASRPDVILASSPSMFLGPAALAAARRTRSRFVWDVRDLTWEYGREGDLFSGAAARAAIGTVARGMWWTARRADLVTCATDGLGERLRARVPASRVEVVRNGLDPAVLAGLDPRPAEPGASVRVLYAGLVGHAQGLDVLLDLAGRAPELEIAVAGDGPRRADLEADARRRGLKNIEFLGYQSREELAQSYHRADVLFAQLQRSDLHTATASPSKLLEYMAAGRPIVYAGDGLAAEFVRNAGAGPTVPPGDVEAIRSAVVQLDRDERLRLGRAARAYAESAPSRLDEMRRLAALVESLS